MPIFLLLACYCRVLNFKVQIHADISVDHMINAPAPKNCENNASCLEEGFMSTDYRDVGSNGLLSYGRRTGL